MEVSDGREWFAEHIDVSRETLVLLDGYETALRKWNKKINLVAEQSLSDVWRRHFADSAQLHALAPERARHWLDLGAGAGFPGLVAAILRRQMTAGVTFTLIESDARKAAFLMTLSQKLGISCTVIVGRIEQVSGQAADVISARALAPLTTLLSYAEKHRRRGGICLFPKGAKVHKEIAEAKVQWQFDHHLHHSLTDPSAAVIEIGAMTRV